MSRTKSVTTLAERIKETAPELHFIAAYQADDPQLQASMQLYNKRAFVYVLALQFQEQEAYIYVGQSCAQYERILQQKAAFAFDKVYLFECEATALRRCESAVIRLLKPLFNKQSNPMYPRYDRVLQIDYTALHSRENAIKYLNLWDEYCRAGLYGFSLPPAIYRTLKQEAASHELTVSEELLLILEGLFADEIAQEVRIPTLEQDRTNLMTTAEYGDLHGKSQEQIKQYLHQENRLIGKKFGRDWLILDHESYPDDRRKRTTAT